MGLFALMAFTNAAAAEPEGFDAHGFHLAPDDGDPRDPLMLQRPGRMHGGEFYASGLFEYAAAPLSLMTADLDGGDPVRSTALDNVVALNVAGGVALLDRLRVGVAMPIYLNSTGLDGPQGAGVGDIRVDAMVSIVRPGPFEDGGGFGLGVVPWIDVPVGDAGNFLGQGGVAGGALAAATYEVGGLTVGGQIGAQFRPALSVDNLNGSDGLVAGVGAGYLVTNHTGLNLEAHFAPPFVASPRAGTGSPAEVLLSLRHHLISGPHFTLGGAVGLNDGVGAAAWRVFLGGGFGRYQEPGQRDVDGDGFVGDADACTDQAETMNGYNDDDGCPDGMGKVRVRVVHEGRPVLDAPVVVTSGDQRMELTSTDKPAVIEDVMPGTAWRAVSREGACLAGETSGKSTEGTVDLEVTLKLLNPARLAFVVHDDAGKVVPGVRIVLSGADGGCVPNPSLVEDLQGQAEAQVGAGTVGFVVTAEGYAMLRDVVDVPPGGGTTVEVTLRSSQVRLEKERIVILDMVYFETGLAVIKPMSFRLLDEVAATIASNPQIGRVQVGGHTDDKGADAANLDLSRRRAESVAEYLMGKGVERGRLVAQGFGETRPIDDNKTEGGRAMNRRVEFLLVDQHD